MHSANIQSWLGSTKTAAGAISGITYAEDVATIELYKKQLEGLTLTQQKLAMTTAGLTTEQQKYILSKIEGTAVVGKATVASLAEISVKQRKLLTSLGVITGNEAETGSEIVLTKAKYDELMASELLNNVEKQRLAIIFGVTDANIKQAGSYKLLGGSVKTFGAAVKEAWSNGGMKGLWNALPKMGKIGIIAAMIVAVNKLAGLFYDTTEEIQQKIEDAKNKISETESEISDLDNQINETTDLINKMKEAGASEDAISTYEKENQLLRDQKKILEDIIKDEKTVIANESARLINNEGSSSRLDGMLGALQNFDIMGSSKQTPIVGGLLGMFSKDGNGLERDGYIEDFEKGGFWNGMKNIALDLFAPTVSTFTPFEDPADDIVLQSNRLIEKYSNTKESYSNAKGDEREEFREELAGITKVLNGYIPQLIESRNAMSKDNVDGIYDDEIAKIDDVLANYYKARPDMGFEITFKGGDEASSEIGDALFTELSNGGNADSLKKIISEKITKDGDIFKDLVEHGIIDENDTNWVQTIADKFIEYYHSGNMAPDEWVDNSTKNLDKMTVSLGKLKDAADGIKTLNEAMGELAEEGYITFDSLIAIRDAVGEDVFSEYEDTLRTAKIGSEEMNQALSDLTYSVIEQKYGAESLANATEEEIATILREAGVLNDAAMAHDMLMRAKAQETAQTILGNDIKADSIQKLIEEAGYTEADKIAMYDLIAAEIAFNNNELNVSQKIAALNEVRMAAGLAAIAVDAAMQTNKNGNYTKSANASLKELGITYTSHAKRTDEAKTNKNGALYHYNGQDYEKREDAMLAAQYDKTNKDIDALSGKSSAYTPTVPQFQSVADYNKEVADKAKNTAEDAKRKAEQAAEDAKRKAEQAAEDAKRKAEQAAENAKKKKEIEEEQYNANFQHRLDKINQTLEEYTERLKELQATQDSLYEDDYIGKLDYINQRYEVQSQYAAKTKTELDVLLSTVPKTAEGWDKLASSVEDLNQKYFESRRELQKYRVEMAQAQMDAAKASGEVAKSVLNESTSQFERNVESLSKGGLTGLDFSLTPIVPEDAVERQRKENEELAKEEEIYQTKVNEIKQRAIDEMKAYEDQKRAEQLAELQEEISQIESSAKNTISDLSQDFGTSFKDSWDDIKAYCESNGIDFKAYVLDHINKDSSSANQSSKNYSSVQTRAEGGNATRDIIVNEEGQESYLGKDGKLHFFKPGAQFFNTDEVVRVFSAEDTKKIIEHTGQKYFKEPVGDLSDVTQLAKGNVAPVFKEILPENTNNTEDATESVEDANAAVEDAMQEHYDILGDMSTAANEAVEDAMQEHYDILGDMSTAANEEEAKRDEENRLLKEANQASHHLNIETMQKNSDKNIVSEQIQTQNITTKNQSDDNATKTTLADSFANAIKSVYTALAKWIKENPIKAPEMDAESWEKFIQSAADYSKEAASNLANVNFAGLAGDGNILASGHRFLGTPYVWGGDNLGEGGLDCSGFVYQALLGAGYNVGRTTAQGYRNLPGMAVGKDQLQPGDLVFFGRGNNATHIGIYAGNGMMLHSSGGKKNDIHNPGKGVEYRAMTRSDFLGGLRLQKFAKGTKDFGIAGENYKKEYLINKKTGEWTPIDSPTLIDTRVVDVVGERASARIDKPLPMYAQGTITLPEGLGKAYTYMNWDKITNMNTNQGKLINLAGKKYNSAGYGMVGSRYTVAMTSAFGKVGDCVNIYMSDGTVIPAIIADAKAETVVPWDQNPANKWGHLNGQNVVEFITNWTDGHSNPKSNGSVLKVENIGSYFEDSTLTDMGVSGNGFAVEATVPEDIRRSFGQEIKEIINDSAATVGAEGYEDSLLEYIKTNAKKSTESSEKFIANFEKLQNYQKDQEKYFVDRIKQLKNSVGTPEYESLRSTVATEVSDYTRTMMNISGDMEAEQIKEQFEYGQSVLDAAKEYYNKRKSEGANADELKVLANGISEITTQVNKLSDDYVSLVDSQTEYFVSLAQRGKKTYADLISWVEDFNEKAQNSADLAYGKTYQIDLIDYQIANTKDIIKLHEDSQKSAHTEVLKLYEDEQYKPIFETFDIEKWFDANGELTAQFERDVELWGLSDETSHMVPYMHQLAKLIGEYKTGWYEAEDQIVASKKALKEFYETQKSLAKEGVQLSIAEDIEQNSDLQHLYDMATSDDEKYDIRAKQISLNQKQSATLGTERNITLAAISALNADAKYSGILSTLSQNGIDYSKWVDSTGNITSQFQKDIKKIEALNLPIDVIEEYVNKLSVYNTTLEEIETNQQSVNKETKSFMDEQADAKIDRYIKYQERLADSLNFDITLSKALSTAKEGMYNIFKTLRDEKAAMDKELKANMQIDDWLTEDTRKLLFNLDDYEEQMETINGIQAEAEKLYINYQNELAGLKEDELYKEEEITAEYNRQLEKLQDRLSIAKADLQLAKDKAAFENALKERDTQIIMGNRVQNVADPEKLRDAAMKMAESESAFENEKTTSAENQDIRNMEATTGMINQEKGAIQNRIDMINGMTEEERRVFADFLEPLQVYRNKLLALTKTNPYRIITGDNSNSVFASRDYSKIAGYSLTQDHSGAVDEIQYLLDNGYYKPGTAEYDIALKAIDFLKKQHDDKTTSDPHNYGYSLYDPANSINWYRIMKLYTDAGYNIQSQSRPSSEGVENSNLPIISGDGDVIVADSNSFTGFKEISTADIISPLLKDPTMAESIARNIILSGITPNIDSLSSIAATALINPASGNVDNSINMNEAHFHITEAIKDGDALMTQFVNKLNSEYSTTNNQR